MPVVSIADAKNRLTQIVHQAEDGEPIHITRRGKPVAVLISETRYQGLIRSLEQRKSFCAALDDWRRGMMEEDDEFPSGEDFEGLRASGDGREFSWED